MKVIYFTHSGNRKKNEDSILINDTIYSNQSFTEPQILEISNTKSQIYAVADGIGGRPGGEIASKITLEVIKENKNLILSKKTEELLKLITTSLQKEYKKNQELEGMGTTISCILIQNSIVHLLHIGDSRIYCWQDKEFFLLTRDHTHVQDLVDRGFLKKEEVASHPMRSYLKSALTTNIDTEKLENQYQTFPLENKNFFLCSDGVWELIQEKKLKQILVKESNDYISSAKKITQKCMESNPDDNFSYIFIVNSN